MAADKTAAAIAAAASEAKCLPAGRYEFKDLGIYIGEWLNERAVGLGLITKDKSQGEYTGLWDGGMEKSGVFLWPNAPGAMYEGEWAKNRRNGCGVFTREDWAIKGKFVDDFIAIGVKGKENSMGRFEGEFENGLPSFGVETYADGGTYAGEYKNGVREGLGVRTSIPYGDVINFFPEEAAMAAEMASKAKRRVNSYHQNAKAENHMNGGRRDSLLSRRSGEVGEFSNPDAQGKDEEEEPYSGRRTHPTGGGGGRGLRLSTKFRCGFVLSSHQSELVKRRQQKLSGMACSRRFHDNGGRARSLTNLFHRSASRESIPRIKRQGSAHERSAYTDFNRPEPESIFNLDQEEAIDPETVETYSGQWEADSRNGYGVCERSDGVVYEGQWLKNQRHGYGQTEFPDGTIEQGRYQAGKLVFLSWSKGTKPHMILYNYHIRIEVASASKKARQLAEHARMRSSEANEILTEVRQAVQQSEHAATMSREYSLETRVLVKDMYPDFEQPGIKYLDDMVRLMRVTKRGNQAFELALQAAQDVLAGTAVAASPTETGQDEGQMNGGLDSPELFSETANRVSRAGSHRLKHRSKQRRRKLESRSPESPTMIIPSSNQPLTLIVPQINSSSPLDRSNIPLDGDWPAGHARPNSLTNQLYLNVPTNHQSANWDDFDIDFSDGERGGGGLSRSPSIATTYVLIPRVTDLKPESDVPNVPLSKLITNTNLLTDHFGHYAQLQKQSDGLSTVYAGSTLVGSMNHTGQGGGSTLTHQPQPSPGGITMATTVNSATGMKGHPPGLVRRRTLPTFMTQPPVLTRMKPTLGGLAEKQQKYQGTSRNATAQSEAPSQALVLASSALVEHPGVNARPKVQRIAREQLLLGQASKELLREEQHLSQEASSIYMVDEGVRKRVYPLHVNTDWNNDTGEPSTMNELLDYHDDPQEQEQHSPSLLAITDGTETGTVANKSLQTIAHFIQPSDQQAPSSMISTTGTRMVAAVVKRPPIVANVLLEDIQDEIHPLQTTFRESELDLRAFGPRYSVPHVGEHLRHTVPSGLTSDELTELSGRVHAQIAEDRARQEQGEIIIYTTDFLDWCNRNLVLLIVLLLNGGLVYLFARLAVSQNLDEGDDNFDA